MATIQNTATTTAPVEPRWITLEEAEKLTKKYPQDRRYVKKNDKKSAEKFYFKVVSISPYTPAEYADDPEKRRYQLLISKFSRGKTEKVTINDGSGGQVETERDQKIPSFVTINGKVVQNDKESDRLLDTDVFEQEFTLDTID